MDYRLLAKIGCRLIALYFMFVCFGFLPGAIIAIFDMRSNIEADQGFTLMSSLLPMIFILLISILLWVYADKIAKLIVKEVDVESPSSGLDYDRIQLIAFSFAGVLIAAQALPEMINLIVQTAWQTTQQLMNKGDRYYITYVARIVGQTVKLLLGLWLILGAKGIVNAIRSIRTAGVHERSESED